MSVKDYPEQPGRPGYVVLRHPEPEPQQYIVVRDCMVCGKEARTTVPAQGLWDWEHGMFAQRAFPDLSAGEREQVMSGTHPACWERLYPAEDEDDYEEVGDFGALAPRSKESDNDY